MLSEYNDRLDCGAVMGILKGLVDILEIIIAAELINGQQTLLVILDQLGDEGLGICAALYETGEGDAGTYEQTGSIKVSFAACHADHNCQTVGCHGLKHCLDQGGNTGSFQRELYAAAVGDAADLCGYVLALATVDNMGSAALHCQLKSGGNYVDGDDSAAACQLGGHDGADTYRAAAEYCDSVAGLGLHTEKNRTCTGLYAAAKGAERLQIQLGVNLDGSTLCNDAVVSKGTLTEEGADRLALIIGDTLTAVAVNAEEEQRHTLVAGIRMAVMAVCAMTAGGEGHNYMVTGLEGSYALADFFNDTYALMAENDGELGGSLQIHYGRVGVANAAGNQLYKNFTYTGFGKVHFLNGKLARLANSCGFDLHSTFLRYNM